MKWAGKAAMFAGAVVVAIVVSLIIVMICGGFPMLTDGTVVDKSFQPARTEIRSEISEGESGIKNGVQTYHYPASWLIRISGYQADGKARAEWWSIGGGLYELISIGDQVRRDKGTGVVSIVRKNTR